MYTLVSAIGKKTERWESIDISNMVCSTIYNTYRRVKVILSNPFLPNNVCLDLEDVRDVISSSMITFNEYLISLDNKTLPTTNTLPSLTTKYAKYCDAFRAGYKVIPVNPTKSFDAEIPIGDKDWLYLTKEDTDLDLFAKHCMVSLNGYFHFVDGNSSGIWIKDGMKSGLVSRQNQIGILSFLDLGAIEYIELKKEMLYKQNSEQQYRHRVGIDVGRDLNNKTIMIVIGGYLHLLDPRVLYRTGDQTVMLDLCNVPLFERFHESQNYIDLSSLPVELSNINNTHFGVDDFLSDANIEAYLTLSQSFIVLLDNTEIYTERLPVKRTKMPGMYISYQKPWLPMFSGVGRLSEYWSTYEDGQWSITSYDTKKHRRIYETVDAYKQLALADSRNTQQPVRECYTEFLKIATDLG